MSGNYFRMFSFLMVSLLLVGCASQKSATPLNTTDGNPELNSSRPAEKADNGSAEKPQAVPASQPGGVEKERKPGKETGAATEQASAAKAETVPENVSPP